MYAQVVFPLPFRNAFTYSIPKDLGELVNVGVRVVVPFGKRVLTGFVIGISDLTDVKEKIKPVHDVLDDLPIFDNQSIKFYEWLSEYYLSSLGEALKNCVPYGSEIESKRKIVSDPDICLQLYEQEKKKTSIKAGLLKLLSEKETISITQLQRQLKKKNIYSSLKSLEKIGAVSILDLVDDAKVRVKTAKFVKLSKPIEEVYDYIPELETSSPKQVLILLELISNNGEPVLQSELLNKTKTHSASLSSLLKKELIEIVEKEVERKYSDMYTEDLKEFNLADQQKKVIDEIENEAFNNKFKPYLLHGVTGSGKTQIYIELAKSVLKKGKTILILVPEISLTPQITSRFYNNFGEITTVMHSRMSLGERYDSWRNIIRGKYKVVIGPRSALFAPLKKIGLIVVDEEHDSSYKQQDQVPKYNARDAAVILAKYNDCPVVLGSATPSIESMHNAETGKYKLLELKDRVDNAKMPKIRLVDITLEKKKGKMQNVFSNVLIEEIDKRIKRKENVIILQNRRGFSTQVYCDDCGSIETCPDCSVSLVHHINKNILQCHYCGFTKAVPKACSVCGSLTIKFFGTGTQKVEDEIAYYFPKIRIERVDSDTINSKGKLGTILNSFRKGEIDILVGTQMVSKGLDFSNVTLVGVISAETTLWLPDFRADERTFQLLTQVSGRAGRSASPGDVLIQTQNNKHFVLQKILVNDYKGFYSSELRLRERGGYPPYTRIALIETKDENEVDARGAIKEYHKFISVYKKHIHISPPNPALISKLKGQYRFHLLVRSFKKIDPSGKILRTALLNAFVEFNQKSRFRDIRLTIDVDPQTIM